MAEYLNISTQELKRAIGVLIDKYDYAIRQDFVKDPISYALYYTWKAFDKKEQKDG